MHSVLVTLVAGLLGSAPPDSSSVPTHRESDGMLRAIDHHAKRARRERFVNQGKAIATPVETRAQVICATRENR